VGTVPSPWQLTSSNDRGSVPLPSAPRLALRNLRPRGLSPLRSAPRLALRNLCRMSNKERKPLAAAADRR